MNKYKSGVLAALLGVCASGQTAFAEERIQSFDSTITMSDDGTLQVREIIRVEAEHGSIKRGIFRDFSTIYPAEGGRQVVVGFRFDSARRDGQPENWRLESRVNGVRIYLGSPDRTVDLGEHTYEIVYRTDRQMGFFSDHDELYWNVTGNGWDFPIDRATARLVLPDSIPRDQVKLQGYTGAFGTRGQTFAASMDGNSPYFATTQPLGRREGLTIVAMWPKGYITQAVESGLPRDAAAPTQAQSASGAAAEAPARRFPHLLLILIFAGIGCAYVNYRYYRAWDLAGRDPPMQTIIPEYEPPEGLSPAAMRYLLDMGSSETGFTATILSLAVKGHLHIDVSKGFAGFGKTYTLRKDRRENAQALAPEERAALENLFRLSDVLELKRENNRAIRSAINAHDDVLDIRYSKGYFDKNGDELVKGILFTVLVVLPLFLWAANARTGHSFFGTPMGWIISGLLVATIAANFVWVKLLKAPTVKGAALTAHILGFKKYLQVAEGEDLEKVAKPPALTPRLFEAYLPAALALGVQQKWAERFASVFDVTEVSYSPSWYAGSYFHSDHLPGFTESLGSSLSGAISSASQAPGSSSGGHSGSSDSGSGSSGGSSGGGGGGGGGGGW